MMRGVTIVLILCLVTVARCNFSERDWYEEDEEEDCDCGPSIRSVIRQNILQQLYLEEKTRSEGDSGVKQIRGVFTGTRPYYADSYTGFSFLAMHDHGNLVRTAGLGEFTAVLNGVEFRTRHNDYQLVMPASNDKTYHKTEPIPFPDVPPSVMAQPTIDLQVAEMRKYLEAFSKQDITIRDYRPYFKPVMCYLEGAWTKSTGDIDESFPSDRHWIEAKNWHDLQEMIRFDALTGNKDSNENRAYLPTSIFGINGTFPVTAQWNYRILCHPLKEDLPLDRFRVVDDLQARMRTRLTLEQFADTRTARFQLNPRNSNAWVEGMVLPQALDEIFAEIPGWDNYGADIKDEAYNVQSKSIFDSSEDLNAAYYHRYYRVQGADAMGQTIRSRGYADENLYVAMNTQEKVMGLTLTTCEDQNKQFWDYMTPPSTAAYGFHQHPIRLYRGQLELLYNGNEAITTFTEEVNGHHHVMVLTPVWDDDHEVITKLTMWLCYYGDQYQPECEDGHVGSFDIEPLHVDEVCEYYEQKVTYAIPLEIIYMTPLSSWNPYNLVDFGAEMWKPEEGGKNGITANTALLGVSNLHYFLTPSDLYTGKTSDDDPADTSGGDVWVQDPLGIPRKTRAAGPFIHLPEIEGVGKIRLRYPIAPIHGQGDSTSKELEALKDLLLRPVTNQHMFYEDISGIGQPPTEPPKSEWWYTTAPSYPHFGSHVHRFMVNKDQMDSLKEGHHVVVVMTGEANGHTHILTLLPEWNQDQSEVTGFSAIGCLNESTNENLEQCWDGHGGPVTPE